MIAKGNLHKDGGALAAYLVTGKKGERAELIELRGFASADIATAFLDVEIQAYGTRCQKPFFHAYTRLAPGEELTREQWLHVADREEKRLGFAGQPRAVAFHHQPDGATHMHIAWSRIDTEQMKAIDPGLYKNHLKELSRTLEKQLDLQPVRNERAADDRTRAPERGEFEEARRLKTDLKAIRNTILECVQQADSGKAFNAALEARGLVLANGDRRDCFVVIDQAGGHHALNKRLTGMTLAETRERFGDLDRAQLPSVEQAKERQEARGAERENLPQSAAVIAIPEPQPVPDVEPLFISAAARITEPPAPIFDRDAADAAWMEQVNDAGIASGDAARAAPEPDLSSTPAPASDLAQSDPEIVPSLEPVATAEPVREPADGLEARAGAAETVPDVAPGLAHDAEAAVDTAFGATRKLLDGAARAFEAGFGMLAGLFGGEPKLTPQQANLKARAAEEKAADHAHQTAQQEKADAVDWLLFEQRRQKQYDDLKAGRLGLDVPRERERDDDHWRDRERERER